MADPTGKNRAVRSRRRGSVNRRMRLLRRRGAEFEIFDLPEFTVELFDVIAFENLDEHADAFLEPRRALAGIDAYSIQHPWMPAADAHHDPSIGQQIGGGDLARQYRWMMRRRADDSGQKANALGALRRRDVKT